MNIIPLPPPPPPQGWHPTLSLINDRFISRPLGSEGSAIHLGHLAKDIDEVPSDQPLLAHMASKLKERKRIPISHKVIEKRRRDRINRCLSELGKTVPMALAKQSSGKLEKAEILEMTVQYLRALHSADFPRGREKELLAEFANYFHYGYHECMKNLVHYLTTVERMETKDTKYARILAFLQSKARFVTEPIFTSLGALPEPDFSYQLPPAPDCLGHSANDPVFQQGPGHGHFSWHNSARTPGLPYLPNPAMPLTGPGQQRGTFLSSVQGLDRHYLNLIGHSHPNAFSLPTSHQHPSVL